MYELMSVLWVVLTLVWIGAFVSLVVAVWQLARAHESIAASLERMAKHEDTGRTDTDHES